MLCHATFTALHLTGDWATESSAQFQGLQSFSFCRAKRRMFLAVKHDSFSSSAERTSRAGLALEQVGCWNFFWGFPGLSSCQPPHVVAARHVKQSVIKLQRMVKTRCMASSLNALVYPSLGSCFPLCHPPTQAPYIGMGGLEKKSGIDNPPGSAGPCSCLQLLFHELTSPTWKPCVTSSTPAFVHTYHFFPFLPCCFLRIATSSHLCQQPLLYVPLL